MVADPANIAAAADLLAIEVDRDPPVGDDIELRRTSPSYTIDTARELTSHGKMAAVDVHRGPAPHTNGFYNVLGWMTVNMLLGNYDVTYNDGQLTITPKAITVKADDKSKVYGSADPALTVTAGKLSLGRKKHGLLVR